MPQKTDENENKKIIFIYVRVDRYDVNRNGSKHFFCIKTKSSSRFELNRQRHFP